MMTTFQDSRLNSWKLALIAAAVLVLPAVAEPNKGEGEAEPAQTADHDEEEFTLDDLDELVAKNDAGEYLLSVPQLFYSGGDHAVMRVVSGLPVETAGRLALLIDETGKKRERVRVRRRMISS